MAHPPVATATDSGRELNVMESSRSDLETSDEKAEELPPLPHVRPLGDADRDLFLSILDKPPPPNDALRRLMSPPQA
jgi:uncharacterized protein (DUF1778 family)